MFAKPMLEGAMHALTQVSIALFGERNAEVRRAAREKSRPGSG